MAYSRLKHVAKSTSMGIHLMAHAYNQALPVMSKHFDMSHMSGKLSAAYDDYKALESRIEAGDKAVNEIARYIRPAFSGYS